jgi:hypothetical protein
MTFDGREGCSYGPCERARCVAEFYTTGEAVYTAA